MTVVDQAAPQEWWDALELVFSALPENDRHRQVLNIAALLAGGEINPGGVWVARVGQDVVAALLCVLLQGQSCLFWPPVSRHDPALADHLLSAALSWSRDRGCKLAQSLLAPGDAELAEPLVRHGFKEVTELLALQHDLDELPALPTQPAVRLEPYDAVAPGLFADTLTRTYQGTLDCPELDGVRAVDEILAGHRGAGKVRPELWWLAFADSEAVGVVLLTELVHALDWDLAYVGVVPEFRGRGIGRVLTLHALHRARREGAPHLLLAVDARNDPARRLYAGLGFVPTGTRLVFLLFFQGNQPLRG